MLYRLVKPSFHKYDVQNHLLHQCIECHSVCNKEYKPNMYACLFSSKGIFYWIPAFAGMTVLWFTAHITLLRNISN